MADLEHEGGSRAAVAVMIGVGEGVVLGVNRLDGGGGGGGATTVCLSTIAPWMSRRPCRWREL